MVEADGDPVAAAGRDARPRGEARFPSCCPQSLMVEADGDPAAAAGRDAHPRGEARFPSRCPQSCAC